MKKRTSTPSLASLVAAFVLVVMAVPANAAVIYQDNFEGGDLNLRYDTYLVGGGLSVVAAPGGGNAMSFTGNWGSKNLLTTKAYLGGNFTDTQYKATFRVYLNTPVQGTQLQFCALANGWNTGWDTEAVYGYNTNVYPYDQNAGPKIVRKNTNGSSATLLDGTYPAAPDWAQAVAAKRGGYWEDWGVEVNVKDTSTDLKLTWAGLATDGTTPVSATWTVSDSSATRLTSGTGFSMQFYSGDNQAGMYIDNILITTIPEPCAAALLVVGGLMLASRRHRNSL
jgi:hypothetical protein